MFITRAVIELKPKISSAARTVLAPLLLTICLTLQLSATITGDVRGIVHDPQHRPIRGAHVVLKAQTSDWTQSQDTEASGEFSFRNVPIGTYTVTASSKDFVQEQQDVIVQSDTSPVLHFQAGGRGHQGKRPGFRNSGGSDNGHGHADHHAEPAGHPADAGRGSHQRR